MKRDEVRKKSEVHAKCRGGEHCSILHDVQLLNKKSVEFSRSKLLCMK